MLVLSLDVESFAFLTKGFELNLLSQLVVLLVVLDQLLDLILKLSDLLILLVFILLVLVDLLLFLILALLEVSNLVDLVVSHTDGGLYLLSRIEN